MRLEPWAITTLVVAACGALFVVLPAQGDERGTRDARGWASTPVADPPGECKSLPTFVSSAVPVLRSAGCTGCHGGADPAAAHALDLSGIGKSNAATCALVLQKVNLADRPSRSLIQAPAGSQAHAGGKVPDTKAFTEAMLGWIKNE